MQTPRAAALLLGCRQLLALRPPRDDGAVDLIPVADQVARSLIPWERPRSSLARAARSENTCPPTGHFPTFRSYMEEYSTDTSTFYLEIIK